MNTFIIFPNQLFEDISLLKKYDKVIIIYEDLFFDQLNFHKTKIAYHIATSLFYNDYLLKHNINSEIIDLRKRGEFEQFFKKLSESNTSISYYHTVDFLLEKRIKRYSEKYRVKISWYDTLNFILPNDKLDEYKPKNKRYFQTDFYTKMRKHNDILMELGKPIGGKWSFDSDNRKKIPKELAIPAPIKFPNNKYRIEAINFVKKFYTNNYGDFALEYYPINYDEANFQIESFIENRLTNFGIYQDAILKNEVFNFHSNISAALNIGLLSPNQVINKAIEAQMEYKIPINSVEGFVRQVLGWREFIRLVYMQKGVFQRTNNHFNFTRNLSPKFWNASTGIEPLDDSIKKVIKYSYCHHIERLMILGSFMFLSEYNPDEVYKWFMSLFIDAYDWVMVPNVYGMSQYADNGLITTKPYISGSNYIIKMSDYKRGEWSNIWDALYWRNIISNIDEHKLNQRMGMPISLAKKFDKEKIKNLFAKAEKFLF